MGFKKGRRLKLREAAARVDGTHGALDGVDGSHDGVSGDKSGLEGSTGPMSHGATWYANPGGVRYASTGCSDLDRTFHTLSCIM